MRIALGLGETDLSSYTERDRKSISTETTFSGTSDRNKLFEICKSLCLELSEDLAKSNIYGKVVTLKIKTTEFQVKTRAHSLSEYTQDTSVIWHVAKKLLQVECDLCSKEKPLSLRLLGVRMSNFSNETNFKKDKQKTLTELFKTNIKVDIPGNYSSSSSSTPDSIEKLDKNEIFEKNHVTNNYNKDLENFTSNNQEFTCPICSEVKLNWSLNKFNEHIDNCLSRSKTKNFEEKDMFDSDGDSDGNDNSSSDMREVYECPVCMKINFDSLLLLNQHIDECLSIRSISEKEQAKESKGISLDFNVKRKCNNSESKNKKPKTANTIFNYFSK